MIEEWWDVDLDYSQTDQDLDALPRGLGPWSVKDWLVGAAIVAALIAAIFTFVALGVWIAT